MKDPVRESIRVDTRMTISSKCEVWTGFELVLDIHANAVHAVSADADGLAMTLAWSEPSLWGLEGSL